MLTRFFLFCFACLALIPQAIFSQSAKIKPPAVGPEPALERLRLNPWPERLQVPSAEPLLPPEVPYLRSLGALKLPPVPEETSAIERTFDNESGMPIWFRGSVKSAEVADADRPIEQRALAYVAALLRPEGIERPAEEFIVRRTHQDEQGTWHVRLEQVYKGVPVYGAEVIAHAQNGVFTALNGRYYPTPQLSTVIPILSAEEAVQRARAHLGTYKTQWTEEERALIGGSEAHAELVIYHHERRLDAERLAYVVTLYADLLHRKVYFVDALDGSILHHFDHTCRIAPFHGKSAPTLTAVSSNNLSSCAAVGGNGNPVVASGLDLKNVNRTFGAWRIGNTVYMQDASKPMFNASASKMPNNPVGVIVTLNAKNTTPANPNTFDYTIVTSPSTVFNNRSAVSAHWNAIQSHDYFRNTHGRNSIDGKGGNIISFFNVADDNGGPMDNAFWNGFAIWYGAGDVFFFDLAGSLDVGAHEMSHGVIENTANLEYQYESGALNESFADIFGACVDRGDWLIGEDVVRPGATTHNCLRDMQFPNNGTPPQPKHMNEKYVGPQDNGGVHINSGIVNRAFVLFATHSAVGLDKAERVYYKALRDYLVKSSQFVDCRLAVMQAATDLYGSAVANAAASAFAAVGIGGGQPTNPFGLLKENPGTGLIVSKNNNGVLLNLHRDNGQYLGTLYSGGVASRPSVSDNGKLIVFVDGEGHIIGINIEQVMPNLFYQVIQLSALPEWRNVAISKDGRFVAALTQTANNKIYVFDLNDPVNNFQVFTLYNPTYTTGQSTNDVKYADVLEFDYSGEYIMYDAFNELVSTTGQTLSYWDISFLKFWDKNSFTPSEAPISKLFNGLPPGTSVGNPVFSQMAPYVIAFDYVDELNNRYHILGANVQTGDVDFLVVDNGVLGWPSYTRTDNSILFESKVNNQYNIYRRSVAPNRIQGTGTSVPMVISAHDWGRWFAFGTRSLKVHAPALSSTPLRLSASPNPTFDAVRLAFELPQSGLVRVELIDPLGRTVHSFAQELFAGPNQLEVSLEGMSPGTYIVRLNSGESNATLKVVKQ